MIISLLSDIFRLFMGGEKYNLLKEACKIPLVDDPFKISSSDAEQALKNAKAFISISVITPRISNTGLEEGT